AACDLNRSSLWDRVVLFHEPSGGAFVGSPEVLVLVADDDYRNHHSHLLCGTSNRADGAPILHAGKLKFPASHIRIHDHQNLPRSTLTFLCDIFRQLCPRCRSAQIFRSSLYWGFPKMHNRCPVCGLHFDREPGYFLGAMYISYGLGLVIVFAFGGILWWLT